MPVLTRSISFLPDTDITQLATLSDMFSWNSPTSRSLLWLRGPLKEWATAALEKGRLEQVGIRTSAAMELFSEHCQRKADHARTLWTLLVPGEWRDWVATETDCGQTDRGHNGISANPAA